MMNQIKGGKKMFNYSTEELEKLGAIHTTLEIKQQPKVWLEAFDNFMAQK